MEPEAGSQAPGRSRFFPMFRERTPATSVMFCMNTPTHDEIARQAQEFWQDRGCPAGCDLAIWLEAEQALTSGLPASLFSERAVAETAAESLVEYHLSPALPEQEAVRAAMPNPSARKPKR